MQAIAIERVLARRDDRAGISNIARLREAYQSELITNKAEIEAQANALVARFRQIDANAALRLLRRTHQRPQADQPPLLLRSVPPARPKALAAQPMKRNNHARMTTHET
jgi:hypothetical protein